MTYELPPRFLAHKTAPDGLFALARPLEKEGVQKQGQEQKQWSQSPFVEGAVERSATGEVPKSLRFFYDYFPPMIAT